MYVAAVGGVARGLSVGWGGGMGWCSMGVLMPTGAVRIREMERYVVVRCSVARGLCAGSY